MKRKSPARAPHASGSRLVPCPSCGKHVHLAALNWHLDECLASAAAGKAAQGPLLAVGAAAGPPPTADPPPASLLPPQQQQQQQQQAAGSPLPPEAPQPHREQHTAVQPPAQQQQEQQREQGTADASPSPGASPPLFPIFGRGREGSGSPAAAAPSAFVARGFRPGGSKLGEGLTADALLAACHCELIPRLVSPALADETLAALMAASAGWERRSWWFRKCAVGVGC